MYRTIVVATDGSPTADRAVEEALHMARSSNAKIHIVNAFTALDEVQIESRRKGLPIRQQAEVDDAYDARQLLDRMAKAVANAGVEAEYHAREGAAAAVIVDVAREVQADVIVVGNVGMTGLRRWLGSVPNDVAHHAPCTVMIVRTTS
jgi:nucleotide-binding universal stress UspA family protein